MSSARSFDEPRRSRVEQKILRCVAAGDVADFSTASGGARKSRVAASFIRDLWIGLDSNCCVHPRGLHLKGLRIIGALDLRGIVRPVGGAERLPAFAATDCIFEGPVSLFGVSMEALRLHNCKLLGGKLDYSAAPFSLDCEAANIAGSCSLQEVEAKHSLDFSRARLERGLDISNCRDLADLQLKYAILDGPLVLFKCGFSVVDEQATAIGLDSATVKGSVAIACCRSRGRISLENADIARLEIGQSKLRGIDMQSLRVAAFITMRLVLISGGINLFGACIGGFVALNRVVVKGINEPFPSVLLVGSRIEGAFHLHQCLIHGSVHMQAAKVGMHVMITSSKVISFPLASLDLSLASVGDFKIVNSSLNSSALFGKAHVSGSFLIENSKIGPHLGGRSHRSLRTALDLTNVTVGTELVLVGCVVAGTLSGRGTEVAGSLGLHLCWIDGGISKWAIELYQMRCGFIAGVDRCLIASGITLTMMRCSEFQIQGCVIECSDDEEQSGTAIWASECDIARDIFLRGAKIGPTVVKNKISGRISFRNSSIGRNLSLASTICHLPSGEAHSRLSVAIELGGVSIGNDCVIADRGLTELDWGARYDGPAEVHGCISLDDATIQRDVILHRTIVRADGAVRRPMGSFETEERVVKRKRGVAISMREAKISGELELGHPKLAGIVDLRGATIGTLVDGGGSRWLAAGIQRGHLLLDGLSYARLDAVPDQVKSGTAAEPGHVAAERRLQWLLCQFPDGSPDAASFGPQPYEQLARLYQNEGNERARRQVLSAKRDLQRRFGNLGLFERGVGWLLKVTSDYGYSPLRAALSLLLFIAIGWLTALRVEALDAFVLSNKDSVPANPFNPFIYAIDAALPILDLRQDSVFTIDSTRLPAPFNRSALIAGIYGVYEIVGLILVSITVLTFTGFLRDHE